jgi:hypothetical protein
LEEDTDSIPLIDVPVGEEGKPHLIVNRSYNYGPVLQKLKKNAGEGNYYFTLAMMIFLRRKMMMTMTAMLRRTMILIRTLMRTILRIMNS